MARRRGMDSASAAHMLLAAAAAHCHSAPTAGKMAMIGRITAAAAIISSTTVTEAMPAPAVAISPASPWAHAEKDAVVEISRPVITVGRTCVGRIVVVAVGTDRLNAKIGR